MVFSSSTFLLHRLVYSTPPPPLPRAKHAKHTYCKVAQRQSPSHNLSGQPHITTLLYDFSDITSCCRSARLTFVFSGCGVPGCGSPSRGIAVCMELDFFNRPGSLLVLRCFSFLPPRALAVSVSSSVSVSHLPFPAIPYSTFRPIFVCLSHLTLPFRTPSLSKTWCLRTPLSSPPTR